MSATPSAALSLPAGAGMSPGGAAGGDPPSNVRLSARLAPRGTEEINRNYVAKIDSSGAPVTCGTCHRGHVGPEPFVIPPEDGPRPAQNPPPAGTAPLSH